ncbi:hypothetical protein WJX84_010121 [Apatococcus fuscideae]|uniref:Uncharacterized protein n=1 Tax=Apatococcus fuscideae TaxID=2026836 RepID=A0AAW1SN53_9CHLO
MGPLNRPSTKKDILHANPALERLFAAAQAQQTHLPPDPSSTRLQGLPIGRFHTADKQRGSGQPRSPRKDKDRQDAALLRQWLQVETNQFNQKYGNRQESTPLPEFLMLALREGRKLYTQAFQELARQITTICKEHGQLMADIWLGNAAMIEMIIERLRDFSFECRTRLSQMEQQLQLKDDTAASSARSIPEATRVRQYMGWDGSGRAAAAAEPVPRPSQPTQQPAKDPTNLTARDPQAVNASMSRPAAAPEADARHSTPPSPRRRLQSPDAGIVEGGIRDSRPTPDLLRVPTSLGQPRRASIAMDLRTGTRRASLITSNLLRQLNDLLDGCRRELADVYTQVTDLERTADTLVEMESRAEIAENERDVALDKLRISTPRPAPDLRNLPSVLDSAGLKKFQDALSKFQAWEEGALAEMLLGLETPSGPIMQVAKGLLGCLAPAVAKGRMSHTSLLQALQEGALVDVMAVLVPSHLHDWLVEYVNKLKAEGQDLEPLVRFLLGITEQAKSFDPAFYGSLSPYREVVTYEGLIKAIQSSRVATIQRVEQLEAQNRLLQGQLTALHASIQSDKDKVVRAEEAKRRREDEARVERRSPIAEYCDMLTTQGEGQFKDSFIGMGMGNDVPKLFRHNGRVRNKAISKRETEKTIKEIWKEKMVEMRSGKQTDLAEFMFNFFQKRVGISTAVIEGGYNLLFGLWKYAWDADCELFLKILKGELKEGVYIQQAQLQDELEELFVALDKAHFGQETGFLNKSELRIALETYFRVGLPGGKTLDHFDELMQALDEDQAEEKFEHKKVFEEDREFNQGSFAEAIRDQFLQERSMYFKQLEQDNRGELNAGGEVQGALSAGRSASKSMSIMGKIKTTEPQKGGKGHKPSAAIQAAIDAVREQAWGMRTAASGAAGLAKAKTANPRELQHAASIGGRSLPAGGTLSKGARTSSMPANMRRSLVAPLRLDKLPSVTEQAVVNPNGNQPADDASTDVSTERSQVPDEM